VSNYSEEYSFSSFSKLPFYKKINKRLLDLAKIENQKSIVDLGCGTGLITKLILKKIKKDANDCIVYAVDHSSNALKTASEEIGEKKQATVKFIHSEVQNLKEVLKDKVEAVIYCNSIHYVPDKLSLIKQIKNQLKSDGIFVFNTSFFEGSHPPETHKFYRKWMIRSLRVLKTEYGLSPDKSAKVESRKQLTPEEYISILENAGFNVVVKDIQRIEVPKDGYHHISGFSDWIEGILPGVPLDKGCDVLQKSLKDVWDDMKLSSVPRLWLSISAVKKN
tara:strand:- start:24757 stop:25587 length:831 start_codon:yes stop_codon:yes gene_type:complete